MCYRGSASSAEQAFSSLGHNPSGPAAFLSSCRTWSMVKEIEWMVKSEEKVEEEQQKQEEEDRIGE